MNLYFSPLACSLASRIAFYEANVTASYTQVASRTRLLPDGRDFHEVSQLAQVPLLVTDSGEVLTENSAILQYIADTFPQAKLAPAAGMARAQLQKWLGFISTELHKVVFVPLLDRNAPQAVKDYSRSKLAPRFELLQQHLSQHEYLLETFSVADAYLVAVLNWTRATQVDLAQWPAIHAYHQRLLIRPSVAKAVGEELALYQAELARAAA